MSELMCPHCQTKLPENAIFCHICGQPVICQECRTLIQRAARFCNQCGKPLPETVSAQQLSPIIPGYNRVKVDEIAPEYQYHAEMILTNEAIGEFREVIPRAVRARSPISHQEASSNHQHDQSAVVEIPPDGVSSVPQLTAGSSQPATPATNDTSEEAIWKIFRKLDDGKLRQIIIKLKASSKKDYTIRLICLYLYAKEILLVDKVPRADVYEVLDDIGVKDTNTAAYISQDHGIRSSDENCLRLTTEARVRAQQYMADVFKDELEDDWYPNIEASANKPQRNPGKKRKSADDAIVEKWVSHQETKALIDLNQHSVIIKWSVFDQALLGLYGIAKAGMEQGIVASLIADYLHRAFSVEVKANSIGPALSKAAKNKNPNVITAPDGQGYRTTPTGNDYIEKKLKGEA